MRRRNERARENERRRRRRREKNDSKEKKNKNCSRFFSVYAACWQRDVSIVSCTDREINFAEKCELGTNNEKVKRYLRMNFRQDNY